MIPIVVWLLSVAVSTWASKVHSLDAPKSASPEKVLSRKRRFVYPSDSGWVFTATFSLSIPLTADYGSGSLSFTAPFVYIVDSGTVQEGKRRKKRHAIDDLSKMAMNDEEEYSDTAKRILHRESQRLRFIALLEEGFSAGLQQHMKRKS